MSFALISGGSNSGRSSSGNAVTSGTFNSVGADLLFAWTSWYTPGADCVITDTPSNAGSWQTLTKYSIAGQVSGRLSYIISPANTSGTHTVTSTGSSSFMSVEGAAFSAGGAPIFDQETGATGSLVNSLATGSLTPAVAASLVISAIAYFGANNHPDPGTFANSSLDAIDDQLNYTGNGLGLAFGHKLSQASAINPLFTWAFSSANDPAYVAATQAIFKPPAAGGVTVSTRSPVITQAVNRASTF